MLNMASLVLGVGTEPRQLIKTKMEHLLQVPVHAAVPVSNWVCWCRRFSNRSCNAEKSCFPHIFLAKDGNDYQSTNPSYSPHMTGVSHWALTETTAIKQNKTTASLVGLSPQAASVVIRPFIPLCMMTYQEKPSLSMLNFIPNLALAGHFLKALVSIVTQKWVLCLVLKEMRSNVQYDFLFFLLTWELMDQLLPRAEKSGGSQDKYVLTNFMNTSSGQDIAPGKAEMRTETERDTALSGYRSKTKKQNSATLISEKLPFPNIRFRNHLFLRIIELIIMKTNGFSKSYFLFHH